MIKENAPKGATHYHKDADNEIFYFKFINDDVYQYMECINDWAWVDNIKNHPNYYDGLKPL